MFNKFTLLPTDSLYPLRFALDDFEPEEVELSKPKQETITKEDSLYQNIKFREEEAKLKEIIFGCSPRKDCKIEDLIELIEKTKTISDFDFIDKCGGKIDRDINVFKSYIRCVVAIGDTVGISGLANREESYSLDDKQNPMPYDKYYMYTLLRTIPIRLVDEKEFMTKSPSCEENSTEYLGCYYSSYPKDKNQPSIFLCPKRIEDNADRKKIDKKVLYAVVLIHELAHAIMDPTNNLNGSGNLIKIDKPQIQSEADLFMEESLANMITLQYFAAVRDKIDNNDYSVVEKFMTGQPDAYKFGIVQHELLDKEYWQLWRNNKSTVKFWIDWVAKVQPLMGDLKNVYPCLKM